MGETIEVLMFLCFLNGGLATFACYALYHAGKSHHHYRESLNRHKESIDKIMEERNRWQDEMDGVSKVQRQAFETQMQQFLQWRQSLEEEEE